MDLARQTRRSARDRAKTVVRGQFRRSFLDLGPAFRFGSILRPATQDPAAALAESWRAIGQDWERVCATGRRAFAAEGGLAHAGR